MNIPNSADLGMGPPHMWLSHLQTFISYKSHEFQRLTYYVTGKAGQDGQRNCGSASISMQFPLSEDPRVLDSHNPEPCGQVCAHSRGSIRISGKGKGSVTSSFHWHLTCLTRTQMTRPMASAGSAVSSRNLSLGW